MFCLWTTPHHLSLFCKINDGEIVVHAIEGAHICCNFASRVSLKADLGTCVFNVLTGGYWYLRYFSVLSCARLASWPRTLRRGDKTLMLATNDRVEQLPLPVCTFTAPSTVASSHTCALWPAVLVVRHAAVYMHDREGTWMPRDTYKSRRARCRRSVGSKVSSSDGSGTFVGEDPEAVVP